MHAAVMKNIDDASVFVGVAAVADYRPKEEADEKIKKDSDNFSLELIKTPDIISEVAKLESRPFVVGFAAETSSIVEYGKEKLKKKNLDLLFANNASDTFNSDSISVTAISPGNEFEIASANKNVVAKEMLKLIAERVERCAANERYSRLYISCL